MIGQDSKKPRKTGRLTKEGGSRRPNNYIEQARVCANDWTGLATGVFDLRIMFAEVGVRMALLAQEKNLFLDLYITPETPRHFYGDPEIFRTIITAVAGCCLVALKRGGVGICLRSFLLDNDGRHELELEVMDTGMGFPPVATATGQSSGSDQSAGVMDWDLTQAERLVRQLDGTFNVFPIFGWGTRYLICVELMAAKQASMKKHEKSDAS